jgi:HSP20 family protein
MDEWSSLRSVSDVQGEVNRLFDSVYGGSTRAAVSGARPWAPSVDARETEDELVFTVEIPGVQEKDLSVTIMGDFLTVKGERREQASKENGAKDPTWRHVERVYGKFERTFQISMPVQTDKVRATYRDGVLEIRLPKTEALKPRQIKIEVA